MSRTMQVLGALMICIGCGARQPPALAADQPDCDSLNIDGDASKPLQNVTLPPTKQCKVRMSNGFPLPDPDCTPGASNPSLTLKVLRDPNFRTACVRDDASSANAKAGTYEWYRTPHPEQNKGVKQTCELDHLISLELGGADTLDNIWPQCGPSGVVLTARYFKQKDMVENYLAARVRTGAIRLADAQKGIAEDWTQFLEKAKDACKSGKCKFEGPD